eukprot:TRINITY_DN51404_c0_g1_i2.p1 TRINITY_DN51404_c0_g1~~TRINITY_DN51404_c0_g1_i2.p1  ORF type:complete len:151 (-),score=15.73 TRINITY_DN51404_c0_g1_i2:172-624(-)
MELGLHADWGEEPDDAVSGDEDAAADSSIDVVTIETEDAMLNLHSFGFPSTLADRVGYSQPLSDKADSSDSSPVHQFPSTPCTVGTTLAEMWAQWSTQNTVVPPCVPVPISHGGPPPAMPPAPIVHLNAQGTSTSHAPVFTPGTGPLWLD